jgi:GTPase SAR1 family protein
LQELYLGDNPDLLSPPPEIVARDTRDILAFLQELLESGTVRYEAKLLVVGEGGTGKSSLLRALRGQAFDPRLDTTQGIEVSRYNLPHPEPSKPKLTLNTWDFGGQQIYHATHQFFLTKRSLYLVVWNARLGAEQGRLNYWLDTIKALAPDAPVLLVSTHTDERAPDLNYQLYQDAYPQLVGNLSISNKTGAGINELKAALTEQAAQLRLMGQPWPQKWLDAENALLARPEHHINADTYTRCCDAAGVDQEIARGTLGNYLHDLGKILYFRDDDVLCNMIVLKPNWVTKAISYVLTDEAVREAKGILNHAELPRIWAVDEHGQRYERHLYPVFLRLMERFDLSYQIEADEPGDHPTRSLVPQLLPHQPPADLPSWPETPPAEQAQLEMVYRLDFVPAGVMSWFIVRTHRYTRSLHWRDGVMLAYEGHEARVELNPMLRELRLVVRGTQPHNFFSILKNTVDLILARFEGLRIQRDVPCICHRQRGVAEPCPQFYRYENLVRRMEAQRHEVQCDETFELVSVPTLLYGIHASTTEQVLTDIKHGQQEIKERVTAIHELDTKILERVTQVNQLSELIRRDFTRMWNVQMHKLEAECPNTFYLMPGDGKPFNPKNWVSQEYRLYLVCQHPPAPHQVGDGYRLRQSAEWWAAVSPWLNHLITFLKVGVPMGGKIAGAVYDKAIMDDLKGRIGLLDEIAKNLPRAAALDSMKRVSVEPQLGQDIEAVGPALRALHSFLKEADTSCIWGGLHKILTPDGNILWLCAEHREQYEVKPLVLDV